MVAKDLISDVVPTIDCNDLGSQALNWMEIFRVSHLPIINEGEYFGLISDTDIYDNILDDKKVVECIKVLNCISILPGQHIYDVISIMADNKLTVLPVVTKENIYLGLISLTELLHNASDLLAVQNPGGIIILELNDIDYSLTEISQIVETNDAKILSLYVKTINQSKNLRITLKVNRVDLTAIVQTFLRYNYNVSTAYVKEDSYENIIDDRYESLLKYLKIGH